MTAIRFIGRMISAILLFLLFYLVIFPAGTVLKLFGWGNDMRFSPELESTFEARNKRFTKADLEKPS